MSDQKTPSLTERERQIKTLHDQGMSHRKIAAALSISHSGVFKAMKRMRRKGLLGTDGMTLCDVKPGFEISAVTNVLSETGDIKRQFVKQRPQRSEKGWVIPEGHAVKGRSALIDGEGRIIQEWVKTNADAEVTSGFIDDLRAVMPEWAGVVKPQPVVETCDEDMLTFYPLADVHKGMAAWADETGEDYNVEIAEKILKSGLERLSKASPASGTAVLISLGDFFHADDQTLETRRSHHRLDHDGRHMKVRRVGLWMFIWAIDLLLTKHAKVIVRVLPGNHDPEASGAMALALEARYELEKRVTIDVDPSDWWFMQFGTVMLSANHGHCIKQSGVPSILMARRPKMIGATTRRFHFSAHIHHERSVEFPGVLCEAVRPVTAKDAYAAAAYDSQREMTAITFHKKRGRISRLFESLPFDLPEDPE